MAHDVVFKQLIYQILGLDWPSNRPQSYETPPAGVRQKRPRLLLVAVVISLS